MPYKLYYYPGNASFAPHILLEELGVPYELVLVDRNNSAHKSAEYLKLNPAGAIPTLVDGDVVIPETAAIMLHLADKHPEGNMIPPLQSAARAQCYRWLIYMTNTVQAEMMHYFYPERLGGAQAECAEDVRQRAMDRLMLMFDILDAQLVQTGGPYLLGRQYTIADIFLFMMCRWSRNMVNPARNRPHLAPFLKLMSARAAVKHVYEKEQLTAPSY